MHKRKVALHREWILLIPDWSGFVWFDLDRQCSPPSYFVTDWQQLPVGPDRGHSSDRTLTSNSMRFTGPP